MSSLWGRLSGVPADRKRASMPWEEEYDRCVRMSVVADGVWKGGRLRGFGPYPVRRSGVAGDAKVSDGEAFQKNVFGRGVG